MAFDPHANLAYATVTTAPSPADSGLTLEISNADAAQFPDPAIAGAYNCTAWAAQEIPIKSNSEIVRITAKAAAPAPRAATHTQLTITRTQESSLARSIVVGDQLAITITKKVIDDIENNKADKIASGIEDNIVTIDNAENIKDSGLSIIDDDTMATASATTLATSESTKAYVDNGTWLKDSMARQAIINGNFDVWQRGTSVALADVTLSFQADHWFDYNDKNGGTLPTLTRSRQTLTFGDIPNAFYYTRLATNGAGSSLGVSSIGGYFQRIENGVRLLCGNGKKVTISFWARSDIANKRLGLSIFQKYGTGGSPTAQEAIITQAPITLTSTWTKYTATFTTNTLVGKTFGTANDDALQVNFNYMWGTTTGNAEVYPSVTAETYVGSGNIDIAQVQLCAGDVALPFMPKSFDEELRACQRYFQLVPRGSTGAIQNGTTTQSNICVSYRTPMRGDTPALALISGNFTDYLVVDGIATYTPTTVAVADGGFNGIKLRFSGHASGTGNHVQFVTKENLGMSTEL